MKFRTACGALVLAVSLAGCTGGNSIEAQVAALNASRIQQLYNSYSLFASKNSFRGPRDEAELKEFLRLPRYAKNLKLMQIDDIDAIFISERDGQPFRVRYGLRGIGNQARIFEETGVDGKRMVALEKPVEVDEADYEAYWSGEKRPDGATVNLGGGE